MKFSHRWCMIVVLLLDLAAMVSFLSAQTEEPSAVNDLSSAEVQPDSVEAQPSSDESEQKQLALVPSRDMAAAKVKTELLNELRSELLDNRAKMIDWWLEATAIFLTLVGVAAAILGYFGFKRLDRIESDARENMAASERHAEGARRYVKEIKTMRDKVKMDSAVSEAISLQQQKRTDEAIEKWRSIANITEGTDDERAANAWFFIGYLKSVKGENIEAIVAYRRALDLNLSGPNLPYAYFNLGEVKSRLGQTRAALDDYDVAIDLNSSEPGFYIGRSAAKQRRNDSEGAIADLDAAIDLNPSSVSTYIKRGTTKLLSRRPSREDEAREDFEKALNLAREADNADLIAEAERALKILDGDDAP